MLSTTQDIQNALNNLEHLLAHKKLTVAELHEFRAEIIRYASITEKIAIEKNILIANVISILKTAISKNYVKSKNSDVIKIKTKIEEAISKLNYRQDTDDVRHFNSLLPTRNDQ